MRRLHCLPHHTHQVVIEGFQVRLVPELGREGFQGLPRVILPTVEAPVYEGLDSTSQGVEKCRYQECRCHYRQLRPASREPAESVLNGQYAAHVHSYQRHRQSAVDQGAVDDAVDVVEAVLEDSYGCGNGEERKTENAHEVTQVPH